MKIIKHALTILIFANSLMGNELRLQVGAWMGDLEPELEKRYFISNILSGTIMTGWSGKSTLGLYPLGLEYFITSGNNKIVIGINLAGIGTNFSANAFNVLLGAFGFEKLEDYSYSATDLDIGIQIPSQKISILPRIGIRNHYQSFIYNSTYFARISGVTLFSFSAGYNYFEASASDMYLGIELDVSLDKNLSLIIEYTNSSILPNLSGNMSFSETSIAGSSNVSFTLFLVSNRSAEAIVDFDRFRLGIARDLSDSSRLEFGLRQETQKHSYKNYFGFSVAFPGAMSFDITTIIYSNFLANAAIWNPYQDQKKGLLYLTYIHKVQL